MAGEVGIVFPGKTWVRQGLGTLGRIEVLAEATGRYVIQNLGSPTENTVPSARWCELQ